MTESEHTTTKLARALEAIPGVPAEMIKQAQAGYYHDFLSPLNFPEITLVSDLRELASKPATPRDSRSLLRQMAERVISGEFDASPEESKAWAESPEGREAFAELTGPSAEGFQTSGGTWQTQKGTPGYTADEAVKACADLVGRTGAKSFECGYVHDDVPAAEAGWYASAKYKGARIIAEDKASPAEACHELAVQLLSGGQCQHCRKLVTLSPAGAMARDVTLMDGTKWTAEEQAKAGLCHWRRVGDRWKRGCEK